MGLIKEAFKHSFDAFSLGFENECSYGKVCLKAAFGQKCFMKVRTPSLWFSNFNVSVAVFPQEEVVPQQKKSRHISQQGLCSLSCVCGKKDWFRCHFTESELVFT